jgi:Fe-S-cluster containining protein
MSQPDIPFPQSPVLPTMLAETHEIEFSCHKGIGCWNACCSNIDISLTPYDVLRMKTRLGITSTEFLKDYTVPYEFDKDSIAGIKFRPVEGGTACRFMKPEGCDIYSDRPTACRYYPVALLSMRKQDEYVDRDSYALVKEDHCKGHEVNRRITIADYRKEQGLDEYDELARGWRQLVLKKKSSGPTIGKPSLRSRQLFFMACYDIDRFREFVFCRVLCQAVRVEAGRARIIREGRRRAAAVRLPLPAPGAVRRGEHCTECGGGAGAPGQGAGEAPDRGARGGQEAGAGGRERDR